MDRALMSAGAKAPFESRDRVTAVTKDGATTKVRGTVTKVFAPLDSEWTGGLNVDLWEFEVDWDDRSKDTHSCPTCGLVYVTDRRDKDAVDSAPLGSILRHGVRRECCGALMRYEAARDARVSEFEIKKLSAIDLIAELDVPELPHGA